jgi:hypothetical protein
MTLSSNTSFYRLAYILFILLGLYQLIGHKDYLSAASSFGIALIFDPFNKDQKWGEKPVWQKSILILQLGLSFGLLIYNFL